MKYGVVIMTTHLTRFVIMFTSTPYQINTRRYKHLLSDPQEKFPASIRRARNLVLPPRVLTVWILLGPNCNKSYHKIRINSIPPLHSACSQIFPKCFIRTLEVKKYCLFRNNSEISFIIVTALPNHVT